MERITITKEMILMHGCTTRKGLCDTEYIIYRENENIVIAGTQRAWDVKNGNICVYPTYTRRLAKSLEEFYEIPIGKIENYAYGAWMDGARG